MGAMAGVFALLGATSACDNETADHRQARSEDRSSATTAPQSSANDPTSARTDNKSIIRPAVHVEAPASTIFEPANATIHFEASSSTLDDDARATLDEVLQMPILKTDGRIVLRGHTDSHGNDGDNLVVSRNRAEAVRRYLEEHDVASKRMEIIAFGEANPIAPNAKPDGTADPDGQAQNRRVEIEVLPPEKNYAEPLQSPSPPTQ